MNNISIYFNIFKVPLPATATITLLWRGWRKGDAENTRDIVAILHCTMYSYIYGMRTVFSFPFVGTSSCKCWCNMGTIRRGQGVTSASSYTYNHFDVFFSPFLGSAWFTVSQLYTSSQMWLAEVVREQNWLVGYLGGFGPWTPLRSKGNPLTWLDPVQKWLAWKGCRRPKVPMTSAISLVASRLSMSSLPNCFWFMHMPSRREMTLEPTLRPAQGGTVDQNPIRNLSCWNAKVLLYSSPIWY